MYSSHRPLAISDNGQIEFDLHDVETVLGHGGSRSIFVGLSLMKIMTAGSPSADTKIKTLIPNDHKYCSEHLIVIFP